MELQSADRPVANPLIILREEFDDWAILFDPDSGDGYGLNPVGVFIWKLLDGTHSLDDILSKLRDHCENVPGNAERDITEFIRQLIDRGLAGFEIT